MKKILQITDELIKLICETDAYKEYQAQKEIVHDYPEIKQKLNDFRERNFVLQNSSDDTDFLEELERFEQDTEEFLSEPLVNDFISAEVEFCRMMQEINTRIMEGVEFE